MQEALRRSSSPPFSISVTSYRPVTTSLRSGIAGYAIFLAMSHIINVMLRSSGRAKIAVASNDRLLVASDALANFGTNPQVDCRNGLSV
jgi:hypothetical protein